MADFVHSASLLDLFIRDERDLQKDHLKQARKKARHPSTTQNHPFRLGGHSIFTDSDPRTANQHDLHRTNRLLLQPLHRLQLLRPLRLL